MRIYFFSLLLIFALSCTFKPDEQKVIRIGGSDTMLELTTNLAQQYMKENPAVSIIVEGGGTATGIKALIKGQTDICTASRNLKPDEAKLLADYYGTLGLVYLIAKDALSIYVNKKNNLANISMKDLKKIFSGEIENWNKVGGRDTSIIAVSRNPNSGTYLYFKEHVMEGSDYKDDIMIEPTTKAIISFIEENENAIGYGGMGYRGNVSVLNIDEVELTENNIRNDTYPIIRYLHFLTTKTPTGEVKRFIDWVLSPSGQSIVRNSGYIPLWENKL